MNLYSDNDPFACAWMRNLIEAGHVPPGRVLEKDIEEVTPDEVKGYTQCHWFGGILGWPLALRLAGWDAARPVWTASLPCQPWSTAGRQKGEEDERHLWPVFFRLVRGCMPDAIIGEQVGSSLGRRWMRGVASDLERLGYDVAVFCLPAAGAGAPHIRHRLFWGAHRGAAVQEVQEHQAFLRVLQEQSVGQRLPRNLQGLLPGQGAGLETEAGEPREDGGHVLELPQTEADQGPPLGGEVQVSAEGHLFRHAAGGGGSAPGHPGSGIVPGDGTSIRSRRREDVEQPFDRPDRQQPGLRRGEREGGPLLRERDGERLGGGQDCRDSPGDADDEAQTIERPPGKARGETEGDNLSRLLAGIHAAMGGEVLPGRAEDSHPEGASQEACEHPERAGTPVRLADLQEHGWGQRAEEPGGGGSGVPLQGHGRGPAHGGEPGGLADAGSGGVRDGGRGEAPGQTGGGEGPPRQRERVRADAAPGVPPVAFAFDERSLESIDRLREQGWFGPEAERVHAILGGLGHAHGTGREQCPQRDGAALDGGAPRRADAGGPGGGPAAGGVGDAIGHGRQGGQPGEPRPGGRPPADAGGPDGGAAAGGVGDSESDGEFGERRIDGGKGGAGQAEIRGRGVRGEQWPAVHERPELPGQAHGPWDDYRIIPCRDGKYRRIGPEPGTFPLSHAIPRDVGSLLAKLEELGVGPGRTRGVVREARKNRVGRLRAYGNAIVPTIAAIFIRAFMDSLEQLHGHAETP